MEPAATDAARLAAGLREALQLELLDAALAALTSAGVRGVAFRGAELVRSGLYPEPGTRVMGDVDLLVPVDERHRAFAVLRSAGFTPWMERDDPAPLWLDAVTLTGPREVAGLELNLDLHWRISRGHLRFGIAGLEPLLPDGDWTGIRDEPHFVHLVEHYLRHLRADPHPVALRDLARLAPEIGDWEAVVRIARTGPLASGTAALLEAVRRMGGEAEGPFGGAASIPADVPGRIARVSERLVASMRPDPDGPLAPGRLAGLRRRMAWAGGPIPGTAQLLSAAFPDRAWLASRWPDVPAPLRLPRLWGQGLGWLLGIARSPVSGNQEFEPLPKDR